MKSKAIVLICIFLLASATSLAQDAPTPTPSIAEQDLTATPTAVPMVLDPLLGISTKPPFEIALPEGWQLVLRDTFTYQDLVPDADGQYETLPIDVYYGPVTDGDGWIIMLWGFDSLLPVDNTLTEAEFYQRAAWLNGLRMLQFVVFDPECNIGTAPQRDYTIGDLPAVGTTFSAVDCPYEQPDTRGWFAALSINNLNFAFYAYADPIIPAGSIVEFELQAIIDTVVFNVEDITITAQEFEATRQAILLTPRPTDNFVTATPQP